MPFMESTAQAGSKRKRPASTIHKSSKARRSVSVEKEENNVEDQVVELEAQILESRKHYNNIVKLLQLAREGDHITESTILPAVALCRVYCRLYAGEALAKTEIGAADSEVTILRWLKARLSEYVALLCSSLAQGSEQVQITTLTLAMRLVKEEVNQNGDAMWEQGIFPQILKVVLSSEAGGEAARDEFCENYFSKFGDVWSFTLAYIAKVAKGRSEMDSQDVSIASCIDILMTLGEPPKADDEVIFYAGEVSKESKKQFVARKQKKQAQLAWMAVLKSSLSKQQNKAILGVLIYKILPWFAKVELLMDYLTESFDLGGGTSLLALSGLFHLMQERNLDYPMFYQKLYSLLDDDLLHSKHRSRFFRLLDQFMGSTHLPAALVASFIKRLSRQALHAPPAGIVVVVPWIYNMFKQHPQCTYMIHRIAHSTSEALTWETEGFKDPFLASETDPMATHALDSSIWEIHTLQHHWHPNVATLAKVISEQFLKPSYNMEDFLDHSYNSLLDAELGKDTKRTPVVEWEIPKRVFLNEDGTAENDLGTLMNMVTQATSG